MFLIVPLGLFHMDFKLNSLTRASSVIIHKHSYFIKLNVGVNTWIYKIQSVAFNLELWLHIWLLRYICNHITQDLQEITDVMP